MQYAILARIHLDLAKPCRIRDRVIEYVRVRDKTGVAMAKVFFCLSSKATVSRPHFSQLTLFPRVSKTTETKLRESRAIARKHFVKQCLLKNNESIVLTLMKGDEVVEVM